MIRELKMLLQCRFATALLAACIVGGATASTSAAEISFGARSPYNGVPNAGSNIVVYNLPASGSFYAGSVDSSFDLTALVNAPGTESAAGYGLIMTVGGAGEVVFNPIAPVDDANTLTLATNPAFPSNSSFDLMFASTGAQGGGVQEIDIVVIEEIANANNAINNGDGLASVPFRVGPGVTGNFNVAFSVAAEYTGFVKSLGGGNSEFLTNAGAFPHVGTTIEVRQSKLADMDGSGALDAQDISPFIAYLTDPGAFAASRPWLQSNYISDMNDSGATDAQDIQGFINALAGGGGSPAAPASLLVQHSVIPEPSTWILACLGLMGVAGGRFWRRQR